MCLLFRETSVAVAQHITKLINDCFDANFEISDCLSLCGLGGYRVTREVVEVIYTERQLELI